MTEWHDRICLDSSDESVEPKKDRTQWSNKIEETKRIASPIRMAVRKPTFASTECSSQNRYTWLPFSVQFRILKTPPTMLVLWCLKLRDRLSVMDEDFGSRGRLICIPAKSMRLESLTDTALSEAKQDICFITHYWSNCSNAVTWTDIKWWVILGNHQW